MSHCSYLFNLPKRHKYAYLGLKKRLSVSISHPFGCADISLRYELLPHIMAPSIFPILIRLFIKLSCEMFVPSRELIHSSILVLIVWLHLYLVIEKKTIYRHTALHSCKPISSADIVEGVKC